MTLVKTLGDEGQIAHYDGICVEHTAGHGDHLIGTRCNGGRGGASTSFFAGGCTTETELAGAVAVVDDQDGCSFRRRDVPVGSVAGQCLGIALSIRA